MYHRHTMLIVDVEVSVNPHQGQYCPKQAQRIGKTLKSIGRVSSGLINKFMNKGWIARW